MDIQDPITPAATADILQVTRSRVRQFVQAGELKSSGKFGNTTMFSEAVVREFKKKRDEAKSRRKDSPK